MLSPEHVRVRRRGNELQLLALTGELRERALSIAAELLVIAREHVGKTRGELEAAWDVLEVVPRERKILAGLKKLVEDAGKFEAGDSQQAADLRREVFALSAAQRRGDDAEFDRDKVLGEVAARRGTSVTELEHNLYADLRIAERLTARPAPEADALVVAYERASVQAIFLRAVRVVAEVSCAGGDAYRALFQKLKFRRLLYRVEPLEQGGYRLEIDGPFSLFQGVAKYGLELALVLPALEDCQRLSVRAEVRWSARGKPLTFRYEPKPAAAGSGVATPRDEVSELLAGLRGLGNEWQAELADRVLDLPGVGVCVPDLALRRAADGAEVLVEVLGFWSRASVWQRVELARRGLGARVLFVVSSRLRVSEEVLGDDEEAALYVYKGQINPRAILRHAEALAKPPSAASPGSTQRRR